MVAEYDGGAIAFMSVSADVNTLLLAECFELGPLHGLLKPHPDDVLSEAASGGGGGGGGSAEVAATTTLAANNTLSDRTGLEGDSNSSVKSNGAGGGGGGGGGKSSASDSKRSVGNQASVKDASLVAAAAADAPVDGVASGVEEDVFDSMEDDFSHRPSRPGSDRILPVYKGDSNVFCVQLFCIHEEFEMRSLDFLPKVFELFPDRDYCIITVPHLVPEFPLLQQFVRVTPRHSSTLPQVG